MCRGMCVRAWSGTAARLHHGASAGRPGEVSSCSGAGRAGGRRCRCAAWRGAAGAGRCGSAAAAPSGSAGASRPAAWPAAPAAPDPPSPGWQLSPRGTCCGAERAAPAAAPAPPCGERGGQWSPSIDAPTPSPSSPQDGPSHLPPQPGYPG